MSSDSIEQKDFYNNYHPSYLEFDKNIPYARYLVGRLITHLQDKQGSVLEVGAGQGRFTFELANHIKNLWAVDISKHEILLLKKYAKEKGYKNIKAEIHDLLTIKALFKKKKFDHIVGFFILHHLPKRKFPLIVRNLNHYLNQGGRLSFIEPNNLYPFHLVEIAITKDMEWRIEKGIYSNYLSCFQKACLSLGLKKVKIKKFGFFPPPFINKWPFVTAFDRLVENTPFLKHLLCPFVLLTFEKP